MFAVSNHFVDCCFCNLQSLYTSGNTAVNHCLHYHLPDFHLSKSISDCSFSVDAQFMPTMKCCKKCEICAFSSETSIQHMAAPCSICLSLFYYILIRLRDLRSSSGRDQTLPQQYSVVKNCSGWAYSLCLAASDFRTCSSPNTAIRTSFPFSYSSLVVCNSDIIQILLLLLMNCKRGVLS